MFFCKDFRSRHLGQCDNIFQHQVSLLDDLAIKTLAQRTSSAKRQIKTPFSRSHQHQVKLQTILAEAARLFNFQGTRATTLGDISQSLGLTKTSLYYYARNKEELVYKCYLASCDAGDEIMAEAARDAATGLESVLNFVKIFLARGDEIALGRRPPVAMLVEIPSLAAKHRKEIEVRMGRHFDALLGFLRRGIEDGSVAAECAPIPTTQALLSIVSWSYVWYGRIPIDARPAVVEQLISLVQDGVSARPHRFQDIEFPEADARLPAGFDRDEQNLLKRNAFLRVGSMMFNERGYMGASLDDVAEQLNVTKGAFYYHIRNKEDLLYQCFKRAIELDDEMIARASNAGRNGAEKIELVLRYLFNVQHSEDGPLIRFRSLPSLSEKRRQEILELTGAISDRLGALISEGIRDGSVRNVNPAVVENAMIGTVDAAPDIGLHMHFSDNARVSAEYLQLFFNGIANRRRRRAVR